MQAGYEGLYQLDSSQWQCCCWPGEDLQAEPAVLFLLETLHVWEETEVV